MPSTSMLLHVYARRDPVNQKASVLLLEDCDGNRRHSAANLGTPWSCWKGIDVDLHQGTP